MHKVAFFPAYSEEFGPRVFPLFTPSDSVFEKVAAPTLMPDVAKYIEGLRPERDCQYVLVNAMGSGEFYGSNTNGDMFPEAALIHAPDEWSGLPVLDRVSAKKWPYGFPTFYNANPYVHHRNKDSAKAVGTVELVVWNPSMHRVELVVKASKRCCEEHGGISVWDKLRMGQFPDVSMGCFSAGNLVTMADCTRKPIEEVEVGDLVLTHLGSTKKVTEVHRRQYAGLLYSIRPEAHETIRATRQHPFWSVQDTQVKTTDSYRRWQEDPDVSPQWVYAEDLEAHHLLEPVLQDVLTPDWVDRAFCRLFGYYRADGHVLRNKNKEIVGIDFSVNYKNAIHDEIEELCTQFGTRNTPKWHDQAHTDKCKGIYVFDARLAKLCFAHGGGYAQKKCLSYEAMRWHPDMQREILGAYANSDGVEAKGALKLSTSSTCLAWQWMSLLPRLGIVASISNLEHKAGSGFNRVTTYEWVIHIGKQWAKDLADVCAKVVPTEIYKTRSSRRIIGDYIVTPIRSLEVESTEVEVFNLEIEDDASYIVGGVAVHNCRVPWDNCSICTNWDLYHKALATFDPKQHARPSKAVLEFHKALKAKNGVGIRGLAVTRKEYCDHARYEMNRIYPDGRKVWVVNDFPNFFDISFVFIGAEKCSKMMLKIAKPFYSYHGLSADVAHRLGYTDGQEKTASIISPTEVFQSQFEDLMHKDAIAKVSKTKRAEIVKDVVPSQFAAKAVPLMTEREPDLPKSLVRIMSRLPIDASLGTTASMGMVLKPKEFQRLILTKFGLEDDADTLERDRVIFPDMEEEDRVDINPSCISSPLTSLLLPFMQDRSAFAPQVEKRVTIIMLGRKPDESGTSSPPSELLRKIGSAYKGYRRGLMSVVPQMEQITDSTGELCKVASEHLAHLLSPLSYAYLETAYMGDIGIEKKARAYASAQRGDPSKIACAGTDLSHGDST